MPTFRPPAWLISSVRISAPRTSSTPYEAAPPESGPSTPIFSVLSAASPGTAPPSATSPARTAIELRDRRFTILTPPLPAASAATPRASSGRKVGALYTSRAASEAGRSRGGQMPKIRVGDLEMWYLEAGAGEPLLLIMGFGGDHLAWGFQFGAFAERYRVIAFDNRGAGQTEAPDVPCTTRLMAEDARGLLDALGIDRAHVLGVSMGGMIAQELVLNHP